MQHLAELCSCLQHCVSTPVHTVNVFFRVPFLHKTSFHRGHVQHRDEAFRDAKCRTCHFKLELKWHESLKQWGQACWVTMLPWTDWTCRRRHEMQVQIIVYQFDEDEGKPFWIFKKKKLNLFPQTCYMYIQTSNKHTGLTECMCICIYAAPLTSRNE